MKLCSLIFTLVVSIYGMEYSRHHRHHGLFKNPKAFVSSLNKIDKDTINGMIATVQGLIDDGEAERARYTGVRDSAQDDYDTQEAARMAAEAAEQLAAQTLQTGVDDLALKTQDRDDANTVQLASAEVLLLAEVDAAAALDEKNIQSARIDSEAETLNQVKGLIAEISSDAGKALAEMNKGRKLLAVDYKALASADPSSIDEVIDLIDELLAAGETERATYVDAWAEADQALTDAQVDHAAKYSTWETMLGRFDRQVLDNAAFQSDLDTKVDELTAATSLSNAAKVELDSQNTHLDAEGARLDDERATCEQVIELLEELLGEEAVEEA